MKKVKSTLPEAIADVEIPDAKPRLSSIGGWTRLEEKLPEGDDMVLLFDEGLHQDSEYCGLPIAVSNADFARNPEAILMGYSHWAKVPYPLPR